MSNSEKHTWSWSLADVQKYLNGELSAREMHQLERAALDDPFLADALEGLATREPDTRQQDLTELKDRLDSRVERQKRKLILPSRIRVAAAVILLAGLAFTAYYTLLERKSKFETAPALAHHTAPASEPKAADSSQTAVVADSSTLSSSIAATSSGIAANSPAPYVPPHVAASARRKKTIVAAKSKADSLSLADDQYAVAKQSARKPVGTDSLVAFAPSYRSNFFQTPQQKQQPVLLFSGQVLDLNNRPLAGATLSLNGNKQGTVTDDQGKFSLYVPSRDTTQQLNVAMVGYQPASYFLSSEDLTGNIIRLREDQTNLTEVVIARDRAKRTETYAGVPSSEPDKLDSLWTKAAPVTGRVAYLDYLQAGKKGLGLDSTISGVERVSFAIDRDGTPIGFRIEQSLSPAHDAGVIRLISTGSHWAVLHGKKTRVLVSVFFP